MEKMTPDAEQKSVIRSVTAKTTGTLVAGDMGTGKTLIATEILLNRWTGEEHFLVVAPKSTFTSWARTLPQQGFDGKIHRVSKREHLPKKGAEPGLWFINREAVAAFAKETKTHPGYKWERFKWDVIVYDEIHFISNRKSKAYKTAMKMKADLKVGLSGTPFRSNFSGMWSVTRWLWPDKVRRSYWEWQGIWCATRNDWVRVKGGYTQKIVAVEGERKPGAYASRLPNYHRLTRPKLAKPQQILVDLTREQRRIYESMEQNAVADLGDNYLVADIPLTKRLRLREISLAVPTILVDDKGNETVTFDPKAKSSKLDALIDYLDAYPPEESPIIVFTHSKRFAKLVVNRIPGALLWTGDQADAERDGIRRAYLAGEAHVLVATIQSFGTGTDGFQEVASTVIFLSRTESPTDNEQAIGRLDRRGQRKESVLVLDILARDTYDEGQLSEHTRKNRDMQVSLNSKRKRKN